MNFDFFAAGESVSLREGFGRALLAVGKERDDVYLFDADVRGGTGAAVFAEAFPERVIQFGVAEQNAMAAAAGFAESGLIPLVVGFGSFTVMRAHEMLRTAVCYGGRNVKVCCSHLGVDVGPDGATAQMLEDLATCRAIPNLDVLVPACANEIQPMLKSVIEHAGPVYMRIGRSPTPIIYDSPGEIRVGEANILREGGDVSLVACGSRVHAAVSAAEILAEAGLEARVVNLRSVKPIDTDTIRDCCVQTGAIVSVEDHTIPFLVEWVVRWRKSSFVSSPCRWRSWASRTALGEAGSTAI
ncbi:transketolase family protein [Planctomycetota bacterium]